LVTAVVAFAIGVYWAGHRQRAETPLASPAPGRERAAPPVSPPPSSIPPEPSAETPVRVEPLPAITDVGPGQARVALVIDDLGRNLGDIDRIEGLGIPWTGAVLPFETLTPEVVATLRRRGIEFLCHLPMEPVNANPGPGALRLDMTPAELAAATRAALDAVPGAAGVNNHMGSAMSSQTAAMTTILHELGARHLFYLDSRTSATSVGYRLARELGLPATERQVFLDGDPLEQTVTRRFRDLLDAARARGAALAIGHPHDYTFSVLEREVPAALKAGYEFVPASYLLDRPVESSLE
jgi:polysaccharide deacetylase 2 family uncharacterized protein YibQ